MDEGLVQIGHRQEKAHALPIHLTKEHQIGINEGAHLLRQRLQARPLPGHKIGQHLQGLVQYLEHAADLVIPVIQVPGAHRHAPSLAHDLSHTVQLGHRAFRRAELARWHLKGNILLAGGLKTITLHKLTIVGRGVPAQKGRRPVVALDQDTVAILVIQVKWAKQGIQPVCPGPGGGMVPKGCGHGIIGDIVVEPEHRIMVADFGIKRFILGTADSAHRRLAPPGNKALGNTVGEPGPALRIKAFFHLTEHRRHPHPVAAKDAPREGEEEAVLAARADGADFQQHSPYFSWFPCAWAATRRRASSSRSS